MDPATIATLAPLAIQMLSSATELAKAGAMTEQQLADLFNTVGQGIQSTHNQWVALNEKK